MKKLWVLVLVFLGSLPATASEFAIGTGVGTPGANVNVTVSLTDNLNVRGVANYFSTDFDETRDGIEYDLDLDLQSIGGILDWHPGGGGFRISGGLFANGNDAEGVGRGEAGSNVEFGGQVFPADQLGEVDAKVDFDSVAPYLGIGWGNAVKAAGFSFSFDLGVYFQGDPDVTLTTSEVDPAIAALVDAERQQAELELEDEIDGLDLYPYISFGLAYSF